MLCQRPEAPPSLGNHQSRLNNQLEQQYPNCRRNCSRRFQINLEGSSCRVFLSTGKLQWVSRLSWSWGLEDILLILCCLRIRQRTPVFLPRLRCPKLSCKGSG